MSVRIKKNYFFRSDTWNCWTVKLWSEKTCTNFFRNRNAKLWRLSEVFVWSKWIVRIDYQTARLIVIDENIFALTFHRSRKCLDSSGKQLVFAVKKGTDATMLWKATVQIACVKVDPESRQIESYKFLNLKQFLRVFKTFQSHLQVMVSSEKQQVSKFFVLFFFI